MKIEVCCNSLYSVQIAEKLGASRVELCQNLLQNGLTPSMELLREACESHSIPIHVLIRPRMGDFFYTSADLNHIEKSIIKALDFPIAGIVVGHMTNEKGVDLGLLRHWRALTPGLELSFHRAFDRVKNPFNVLEQLVEAGFNRILSSGQQATASLRLIYYKNYRELPLNPRNNARWWNKRKEYFWVQKSWLYKHSPISKV